MSKIRLGKGPASSFEGQDEIIREFSDGRGNGGLLSLRRLPDGDPAGGIVVEVYRHNGTTVTVGRSEDAPTDLRPPLPELWGNGEIIKHADEVADRLGRPRFNRGRTWTWDRVDGYPEPAVVLISGKLFYAAEIREWIEEWMSRRSPRDQILADRGTLTQREAARKHNVSLRTVQRIWQGGAES